MQHTVLLVDDDHHVLHGLARTLRHQPYQLHTACSAEEAICVLKSRHVDVLVADEQMPGMPGSELLAWVAVNFPDVVRIMLTGNATVDTTIRAINEGAVYQFFTKPCNDVQLAIAIRKAIEHTDLVKENRRLLSLVQSSGLGGAGAVAPENAADHGRFPTRWPPASPAPPIPS